MIVIPTPTAQAESRGDVTDDVDLRETSGNRPLLNKQNKKTNKQQNRKQQKFKINKDFWFCFERNKRIVDPLTK